MEECTSKVTHCLNTGAKSKMEFRIRLETTASHTLTVVKMTSESYRLCTTNFAISFSEISDVPLRERSIPNRGSQKMKPMFKRTKPIRRQPKMLRKSPSSNFAI